MDRGAPAHRAVLHIIADEDTTCTIYIDSQALGVRTGGSQNKNYSKIDIELSEVHVCVQMC